MRLTGARLAQTCGMGLILLLASGLQAAPAATRASEVNDLVGTLIQDLDRRDPMVRERAIRRLMLVPGRAAAPLVDAFADGSLATRLGVMEILQAWGGPVSGIDPWQPQSITRERLATLRAWAADARRNSTTRPAELTPMAWTLVQRDLDRLGADALSSSEEIAIRERLARYGSALLPHVREALARTSADLKRERLTCLRYRLVAVDDLVFAWPGGLERLAALDVQTRHEAAEELAQRATAAEEPLLLELFSDPDGMVREISLRGLARVSTARSGHALLGLLQDPEPNVRAAVLKQFAEAPSAGVVPGIIAYLRTEKDADLLVHAIRVLRAAPGEESIDALITLLGHANWQVRAEAAEALGEGIGADGSGSEARKKRVFTALMHLLDDADGFVVAVAVKGLRNVDAGEASDALARALDHHAELAEEVLDVLADHADEANTAAAHLRRFCRDSRAATRAMAIRALCKAVPAEVAKELGAALRDEHVQVRIAAANALLEIFASHRRTTDEDEAIHAQAMETTSTPLTLFGLIFGRPSARRAVTASQPQTQPELATASAAAPATAEAAEIRALSGDERWLDAFRRGRGRPGWMDEMVPALRDMLAGASPEERLAAAVDLVAFARDEESLPVVRSVVRAHPELIASASGALPWLLWEARAALFDELTAAHPDASDLAWIIENMVVWPDARAAPLLWKQFGDTSLPLPMVARLIDALRRVYFNSYSFNAMHAPAADRRRAIADAVERARAGPELQRVAALALLLSVSLQDASAEAARVLADAQASASLRLDAYQIQLLSSTAAQAESCAVTALAAPDADRRAMAVAFLALGGNPMRALRNGAIDLYFENPAIEDVFNPSGDATIIRVRAPVRLTSEVLRPLLDDASPRTAAQVGYLLATLKDSSGLDLLVSFWREHAREDPTYRRLVYRAVAALDDDTQVGLLQEIYGTMLNGDREMREFYWTIRGMSGPQSAALRKQIRRQVGMDNLR